MRTSEHSLRQAHQALQALSPTLSRTTGRGRFGFTMLELQVAVILLTFGIVTLSSLMITQTRVMNKVRGDYKTGTTFYLTQSPDPWVKKLNLPAQMTTSTLTLTAPAAVSNPQNSVTLDSQSATLRDESLTVTVDLTPID